MDFEGVSGAELYDVFYSDWDGTPNPDGQFVTIEAVWSGGAPLGGGLNIAQVDFNGTGKSANFVASFVALGNNAMPSDVGKAVDGLTTTDTTMGNTIGQTQRLRVTVGADSCRPSMPGTGRLIVRKNALGGDSSFSYATDLAGLNSFSITTSGGTGTQTFNNLAPGPKAVLELTRPAWVFANLVCSDPDGGTTVSGQTANIDLDADETVICTYTNCPIMRIEPSALSNQPGLVNVAYPALSLMATAGTSPYIFLVSSGTLPPGMAVDRAGTLRGTPVTPGVYDFTVTVTDANGCTGVRRYRLSVLCPPITLNPSTEWWLPGSLINTPYTQTFKATGGCSSSFTFSVTSGVLPPGLKLAGNGVLSGTTPQSGTFTFTVTAIDKCGCSQSQTYTLNVGSRLLRGMDEFCFWGGGGSGYDAQPQIDNPLFGVPVRNTGGVRYGGIGLCYGRILWANDKVAFKYTLNANPVAVLSYPDVNRDLGIPVPVSTTRRNVFGAGLSPIGFQLYFRPQSRIKPFVSTSGGFTFFKDPVPQLNGARFNFTYDFGGGVQVFRDSRRAFTFGYKYQRISNGGRALNNPGFDGHVFYFGYSIFKARKIAQGP